MGSAASRSLMVAVVCGGVLRLVWVVLATKASSNPFSDPAEYIAMGQGFAQGHLPKFHGGPYTAWFPPGYPLVLAPFLAVTSRTGLASAAFTATLVNAAAGTATIWLTGVLARQWISARAGLVAAWIMAVAPAQIMFTSSAHAESVFTAFAVGVVVAATSVAWRMNDGRATAAGLVGLGALIGFSGLIRSPGVLLIVVAPLLMRALGLSWRTCARSLPGLVAGAFLVLAPWTVRNAVQVGHWSPFSTNNASAVCLGHHPEFMQHYDSVEFRISLQAQRDCFTGSPYDDERLGVTPPGWQPGQPDEARWYREATGFGVRSALGHPTDELGWSARKLRSVLLTEDGVVALAHNFDDTGWPGPSELLANTLAVGWLWAVEALALVGAVRMWRLRGIRVIAGCAVFFLLAPVLAVAYPHQHHPAMPFLAVLAAGALVWRSADSGTDAATAAAPAQATESSSVSLERR